MTKNMNTIVILAKNTFKSNQNIANNAINV